MIKDFTRAVTPSCFITAGLDIKTLQPCPARTPEYTQYTQYLVDLRDFSPVLCRGATLSTGAVVVFGAVVFHKGYELLDGTEKHNNVTMVHLGPAYVGEL